MKGILCSRISSRDTKRNGSENRSRNQEGWMGEVLLESTGGVDDEL